MGQFVGTGMLKDRARAAMIGAAAVESFSKNEPVRISAAIFSAFLPGPGTQIGALLGEFLAESNSEPGRTEAPGTLEKEKT